MKNIRQIITNILALSKEKKRRLAEYFEEIENNIKENNYLKVEISYKSNKRVCNKTYQEIVNAIENNIPIKAYNVHNNNKYNDLLVLYNKGNSYITFVETINYNDNGVTKNIYSLSNKNNISTNNIEYNSFKVTQFYLDVLPTEEMTSSELQELPYITDIINLAATEKDYFVFYYNNSEFINIFNHSYNSYQFIYENKLYTISKDESYEYHCNIINLSSNGGGGNSKFIIDVDAQVIEGLSGSSYQYEEIEGLVWNDLLSAFNNGDDIMLNVVDENYPTNKAHLINGQFCNSGTSSGGEYDVPGYMFKEYYFWNNNLNPSKYNIILYPNYDDNKVYMKTETVY